MFTGIIEQLGKIEKINFEGTNCILQIQSTLAAQLKVDQSLAHDGICLTVVECNNKWHKVVAVKETLDKSNLRDKQIGHHLNLERAMILNDRLDGHLVQGHVDTVALCLDRKDLGGSHIFTFKCNHPSFQTLVVPKGSIAVNGVSLTVVDPSPDTFQVAIIPYTLEYTNFNKLHPGVKVNIEFDLIGKYIARHIEARQIKPR